MVVAAGAVLMAGLGLQLAAAVGDGCSMADVMHSNKHSRTDASQIVWYSSRQSCVLLAGGLVSVTCTGAFFRSIAVATALMYGVCILD